MQNDLKFVKQFLLISTIIITLIVSAVFINHYGKTKELTENVLLQQARALFDEVVLMRRWVSISGGVYTRLKPGEVPNPYKKNLGNKDINIKDSKGNTYVLRIPGGVVRGVSKLSETSGLYTFHVTVQDPLNTKTHSPDAFEKRGLMALAQGKTEFAAIENTKHGPTYRYMAPLRYEDSCNGCHMKQELKMGSRIPALTINIPMSVVSEQLRENKISVIYSALTVFALLFSLLYLVTRRFVRSLNSAQSKLVEMAITDGLTGLLNRKTGIIRMEEEISRATRSVESLACVMVDIDHFKVINDTYGHLAGDQVLIDVADMLKRSTRKHDVVCRYGGEEFMIIIADTSKADVFAIAEKMRLAIKEHIVRFGIAEIKITASFGVAFAARASGMTADLMINYADDALYAAKLDGRDRTVEVCLTKDDGNCCA